MICIVESKAPKEVIRDGIKYRLYKRTRTENSEIMKTSYAKLDYLANNPEELKNDDIKCVFIHVMATHLVTLNIGLYDEYSGDIVVVDKDALRKFAGSEYMIEFIEKLVNLRNRMQVDYCFTAKDVMLKELRGMSGLRELCSKIRVANVN